MIANLLPEDGNNVVGGSVEVNGVSSKDKDTVWSVRISFSLTEEIGSVPCHVYAFAYESVFAAPS